MRYWLLTTEYPPLYGGGISTYCAITAKMLQQHGHQVTVFLQDFSIGSTMEILEEEVRLVRFCPRNTDAHHFLGYAASLSYEFSEIVKRYILSEGKPDVIEAQEYAGIAYYLLQFKWQNIHPFADVKVVITCHSPSFICLEYNQVPIYKFPDYWTGEMEKSCIRSADRVIFPGNYLLAELQKKLSLEGVNFTVVPNPAPDLSLIAVPGDAATDENMIVCFGKLSPLKGTFELLKYFEELWENGSALKLYIIGGTGYFFYPERKTMYDLILLKYRRFIDDKRLILTGNLSPAQYIGYLHKAKLVVVPSLFDNFPYTVLESMSLGKIVLASRQGGQTEMIQHGHNGFLFDHYKKGDFQFQLEEVLKLDERAITQISVNSKITVSSAFSEEIIYFKKMKVISEVVNDVATKEAYPFITTIEPKIIAENDGDPADNPLLSVVIPYYNMGSFLEDTLVSVFNSDYENIEVIVVDDGSTEQQSIVILKELEKKFAVQVLRNKNVGLSATRNSGAALAKGTYLAFLDSDDTIAPTYYSKAISILKRYTNVHFVGCWLTYFGEGQGTWPAFNPEPPYMLIHNTINSSAIVLKRETFIREGANCTNMIYGMEDWESIIRLVSKGYRGVVINEKLFNYRVRKGSMSQSFTTDKQLYLTKLIAQKNMDFYNCYGADIFQLLNSNGSAIHFDNPTFEVVQWQPLKRVSLIKNKLKEYIKRNSALRKTAYFIYKRLK